MAAPRHDEAVLVDMRAQSTFSASYRERMVFCISLQNHAPPQSVTHRALESNRVGAALLRMGPIRDGQQHMIIFGLIFGISQRSSAVAGALLLKPLSGGCVHATIY